MPLTFKTDDTCHLIEGMINTAELFDRYLRLNSAASNCNKKIHNNYQTHTSKKKKKMTKRSNIKKNLMHL